MTRSRPTGAAALGHGRADTPRSGATAPPRKPFQRPRKGAGTLKDLQRTLWYTIARVDHLVHDEALPDAELLKAAHGLAQLAAVYQRLMQGVDLEARVTALETALQQRVEERGEHPALQRCVAFQESVHDIHGAPPIRMG